MPFHIGLVGAGRMGKTHLRALQDMEDVAVTVIAEPHADTRAGMRSQGYDVTETARDLAHRDGVDGFLIAAPSVLHREIVDTLAPTGKPILCEKPAGLSVSDAEHIRDVTERFSVRFQVGYWRRFVPELRDLRRRVVAGDFGRLLSVNAGQWDHQPPGASFRNASGGIFRDMGVHEVDLLRWITGSDIVSCSPHDIASDGESIVDQDAGALAVTMSNGTIGTISLGRFYPRADAVWIEVFGDRGVERMDVLNAETGVIPQVNALREQVRAFARDDADADAATIHDAIAILRVLDNITDRKPV